MSQHKVLGDVFNQTGRQASPLEEEQRHDSTARRGGAAHTPWYS